MTIQSIPGITRWTGITCSLFSVLSWLENGIFTPCDSVWIIAIPFLSGLLLTFTGDTWLKSWVSFVLTISGAGLLFLNVPFLLPAALFLLILGFNPVSKVNFDMRVAGVLIAILLLWIKRTVSWNKEIDIAIIASFSLLSFITIKIWPKPAPDPVIPGETKMILPWLQQIIRVLTNSTLLLILCVLPLINDNFTISAILSGFIVMFAFPKRFVNKLVNLSVTSGFMTLFIALFLLTIMTGFLSRAYGIWLEIVIFICSLCFVTIFDLLQTNLQGQKISSFAIEKREHNVRWICLAVLVFLGAHFPACMYWFDRLQEVSMPEPFIPLALGQYYLKNLVLLPASATLIAGFLFLRRRSLE